MSVSALWLHRWSEEVPATSSGALDVTHNGQAGTDIVRKVRDGIVRVCGAQVFALILCAMLVTAEPGRGRYMWWPRSLAKQADPAPDPN